MAWGKVDDRLHSTRKWRRTSKGGRALWTTALSWCMSELTDGNVPADMLPMLDGNRHDAASLVKSGLWHETDDGWIFHDWLDYQPSREHVVSEREAAAERQRRAREKARESRRDSRVTDGVSHGPPDPTRPDPTHVVNGSPSPGGSPKQRATGNPQPCGEVHDVAKSCGACADARRRSKADDAEAARIKAQRERQLAEAERAQRRADAERAEAERDADPTRTAEARAKTFAAITKEDS